MNWIQQLVALLKDLFLWWVTVEPWQQGVRVRFGKRVRLLMPGMHVRFPLVDKVFVQPVRLRAHYVEPQTVSTRDGRAVVLAGAIQYEVADTLRLYSTLHNAHDTVSQMVQGVLATAVRDVDVAGLRPAMLEREVMERVDLSRFGLTVRGFALTNFAIVRVYRLISGETGTYTDYRARMDTRSANGDTQ